MVKIIDLIKRSKRYYLLRKEVDQARAVSKLFDAVLKDPKVYIPKATDDLVAKYELREEQKDRVIDISERLKKARDIVQSIKARSRSPQEFYKSFFGTNMPANSGVKTFGFTVGVYLPGDNFQGEVAGEARGFSELSLEEILKYNTKQLNGKRNFRDLQVLSFKVNTRDPIFHLELKSKGPGETTVEKHELKHVIDAIISEEERTAEELSADLFSGDLRTAEELNGLILKADDLKRTIGNLERRYQKMRENNLPEDLQEKARRSINSHKLTLSYLEKFPFELVVEAEKIGISYKDLSYIVAMTPFAKLEHRLKLIVDSKKRKQHI